MNYITVISLLLHNPTKRMRFFAKKAELPIQRIQNRCLFFVSQMMLKKAADPYVPLWLIFFIPDVLEEYNNCQFRE